MVREARAGFVDGTKVACVLDARERTMHCHHEKIVIVDDEVAFVGGIDLTALAGDRFDSPSHVPRGDLGWHDAAVRLRGPVVADVAAHFAQRWSEVT
jgi:phosphatidylserine/phosphatidylglycerophosphate/cardiolipin synthase-like enzyme